MKKVIKKKIGFTLAEILVVIALISLIMLIAIPSIALINKRIGKRLYESKKDLILVAAEQYAKDNNALFDLDPNGELLVTVDDLVRYGYIEADEKAGTEKCSAETNYDYGCVVNPENKEILNNMSVLLIRKNNRFMSYWDEKSTEIEVDNILQTVCLKLQVTKGVNNEGNECSCTLENDSVTLTEGSTYCYFVGDNPNNWLYYSNNYWRILGIEYLSGESKYYVKMITEDNI